MADEIRSPTLQSPAKVDIPKPDHLDSKSAPSGLQRRNVEQRRFNKAEEFDTGQSEETVAIRWVMELTLMEAPSIDIIVASTSQLEHLPT